MLELKKMHRNCFGTNNVLCADNKANLSKWIKICIHFLRIIIINLHQCHEFHLSDR